MDIATRIAFGSAAISAVLAGVNIWLGFSTNSSSVFSAGVEFAGDVLASVIVFVGLRIASAPADENHPYGHGRVETLAAFAVGFVVVAAGLGAAWRSLQGVGEVHAAPAGIALVSLLAAAAIRGASAIVKFRVGRRLGSAALVADGWNDIVDVLAASVALTAIALARADIDRFRAADHYGGFAVGVLVIVVGLRVLRDATLDLVDTMPPPEKIADIRRVAARVRGVDGVEKTFARRIGPRYQVDIHILVNAQLTVAASHAIAGEVRSLLRSTLPWISDVMVHVEPLSGVESE